MVRIVNYNDFYKQVITDGYHIVSGCLTHSSSIVSTYKVPKHVTGNFISIKVPDNHILSICGVTQCNIDNKSDFSKVPYLYSMPHELGIICYDEDNNEIPYSTGILFLEYITDVKYTEISSALYGDLSLKIGDKFKSKDQRYYSIYGILLLKGHSLSLAVVKPEIGIEKVELFMRCDLFEKHI